MLGFAYPAAAQDLPKPDRPTVSESDGVYTLRWTKPNDSRITGFDIHVGEVTPLTTGHIIVRNARLDLAGANCVSSTSCYYVPDLVLEYGPGGNAELLPGENYFAVRATSWDGSTEPSMRSEPSDTTTTPVIVPANLVVQPAGVAATDEFHSPSWNTTTATGTFQMRVFLGFGGIWRAFFASSRQRLRSLPQAATQESIAALNLGATSDSNCAGTESSCTIPRIPLSSQPALAAGTYYLAYTKSLGNNASPLGARWTPAHTALGGRDNPLVFPTFSGTLPAPTAVTATHAADASGITLAFTKSGNRHSAFEIFYKTASSGVTLSDPSLRVVEAVAGCEGSTATACSYTIPYADLDGVDADTVAYFGVKGNINSVNSALSAEAIAYPPGALAGDSYDLVRGLYFGSLTLPTVSGEDRSGCVYGLAETRSEALLGLTYTAGSAGTPPSLSGIARRAGDLDLGYSVRDCNTPPSTAEVRLRIRVRAARIEPDPPRIGTPSGLIRPTPVEGVRIVGVEKWQHCTGVGSGCADFTPSVSTATYAPSGADAGRYLRAVVGYRYTPSGGSEVTALFNADASVAIQASLDTTELAKTALPDIVLAMADSTASGIKSRISEVRRGCSATKFSLDGARDFASIVQSQAEYEIRGNRNWRKMLGNSKFAVSRDGDSSDSGFCGVWGQGNFQNLDGEHSGVKWDGSLSGFSLGADTRLGSGKLLGIAVNNQSGAFDVTKDATVSQYDVALSSVSPYLGWQSAGGTDFHASLSVDSGAGEIKTSGNVTKHDLSGFGVGFGFRSSGALKGDLVYASTTAKESVADGADISESVGVGRLRLAWERSRERVLASGASLNLNGEFGGRADTGTAGGGLGAELGFGFGYAKNSLKFGGNLRTLLFHSGDVGEFGAQIRLSIQPGQDGQGLSLNIAPTYGQTQSGLANLWEHGVSKITAVNPDSYQMRVNARLGFGFSFVNSGLVTPYATARYGDLSQFGFGVNWKPKLRDLELDLSGEQSDSQQRVLLKGSLGF